MAATLLCKMATFYIHVANGNGFVRDEEGVNLVGIDAARLSAVQSGADIIAEELKGGCATVNLTMFIEDADHHELLKIPITASVSG